MTASPLRYVMVAGFCLVLNNAVIIAADAAGLTTAAAVLSSFTIVVICGYALHCTFTFREPPSRKRFWKYAAGMTLNIPMAFILIWLLHDLAGFRMIFISPAASAITIIANYILSRWAIAPARSSVENCNP